MVLQLHPMLQHAPRSLLLLCSVSFFTLVESLSHILYLNLCLYASLFHFIQSVLPYFQNRVDIAFSSSAIFLSCARCNVLLVNYVKSSAGGRGTELGLRTAEPNGSLSRPAGRCRKKKKTREEAVRLVCDSPDVFSV